MHDIHCILVVFFISIIVASLAYRPILRFAERSNFYDNPEARKLQRKPIPVMGGFVVFIGSIIGELFYWFKYDCTSIIPIQIAMLLMLLVGAWDDMKKLSPTVKFVIEIVVVVALAYYNNYLINDFHGLWKTHQFATWVAWPLTVFACVGVINAINMIDGIDGLSSGICIIAFGFYSWALFRTCDYVRAALGVTIMGALIPFFIMNVFGKRSKMFIGDAGTLMLGIALCDMLMAMLTHGSNCGDVMERDGFSIVGFTLAVLAIPVFDTIRVMFGRISRGESPFHPDKTHLHHAFIEYGFHHLEAALLEIILTILIILLFMVIKISHLSLQYQLYGVILAGIAVCYGLYWMLGRRKRMAQDVAEKYGITMDEYENMSDEERQKLKENNKAK